MTDLLGALAAVAVLTTVPGACALFVGGPRWPLSLRVAAVPWVSLVVVVLWVEAAVRLWGRTDALLLAGPPVVAGALVAAYAARSGSIHLTNARLRAFLPVLVTAVLALLVWVLILDATPNQPLSAVPPFDDGLRHGWMTARWLALGHVDPAVVLTNESLGPTPARGSSPYPMAVSLLAGTASRISGASVGAALVAVVVLAAAVWLPLSTWAFARAAAPGDAALARALPLVSLAAPVAYYNSWPFGGLPFLVAGVGLLLVPAGVLWTVRVTSIFGAAVTGLVAGSILLVQASVGLLALLLSAMLGAVELRRAATGRRAATLRLVVASAVAAAACGWQVLWIVSRIGVGPLDPVGGNPSTGGSVAEAAFLAILQSPDVRSPWAYWMGLGLSVVAATLVIHGVVVAVRMRSATFLAAGLWAVLLLGLTWIAIARPSGLAWLSAPWYGNRGRLAGLTTSVLLVLVAVSATWLARRAMEDGRAAGRIVSGALLGVLLLAAAVTVDGISTVVSERSIVTADDRAAFDWLAAHNGDGPVLNDPWGAGGWSYAYAGVDPLFPGSVPPGAPEYRDATYLLTHLTSIQTDPVARGIARRLGIRYVFTSPARMLAEPPPWTASQLAQTPGLALVFRSRATAVFEIRESSTSR